MDPRWVLKVNINKEDGRRLSLSIERRGDEDY